MRNAILATVIAVAGVTTAAPHARNNGGRQPSVSIKNGTVYGIDLPQYGQEQFLGIPYAQPPVGQLRLKQSRPLTQSFGDYQATAYSPACWSRFGPAYDDNTGFESSEDCLSINVVRPYGVFADGGKQVPVVAWIHGGGLTTGSSGDYRYNSTAFVQASVDNGRPIVFVSMNYRLGSLGFLSSEELQAESATNLGFGDQRLALQWINENIADFGGNKDQVTVMGESAGGRSVQAHLTAYGGQAKGLFHRAIIQSGGGYNTFVAPDTAAYQTNFNSLIANTSCSSTASQSTQTKLECIRALPIEEFRMASNGTTGFVRDGNVFDIDSVQEAYESGKWAKVPILVGANTDEGRSFQRGGANTTAEVRALLSPSVVPANLIDRMLELYPNDPKLGSPYNTGDYQLPAVQNGAYLTPGSQNKREAAIVGDVRMLALPRYLGQLFAKEVPVYKYRFNHVPWSVTWGTAQFIGHFQEVSYVFNLQNDNRQFWETNHFTVTYLGAGAPIADRALGDYMSRSWTAFIATGNPNNANFSGKPYWPTYSEAQSELLFQTQGSIVNKDDYRREGIQTIIDGVFRQDS